MTATKHKFGAYGQSSKGEGHPIMFGFRQADNFDPFPEGGGYPKDFLRYAYRTLEVTNPADVLHLCSGSMREGVCVDIRPSTRPTVVADCRKTPFRNATFDWIMADPPYSKEWAQNLYGTGAVYPKPGQILCEAARLLRVGGRVGILHFLVPLTRRPLKHIGTWGITTGAGYAIRAWSVFERITEEA